MPRISDTHVVTPSRMSASERATLGAALYAVHQQIFDGVSKASFVKYVVDSRAEHTWIALYRGEAGQIVGYFALHVFERVVGGRPAAVIRGEAGFLEEYRGGNVTARFGLARVLRYAMANPRRTLYYMGSLVHPSSYLQIARLNDQVWPGVGAPPAGDVSALMAELAGSFGLERVGEEASGLVYKVGWCTRESAEARARWQRSENPAVRFFLQANPGYSEGHGLLTLVPLRGAGLVRAVGRYLRTKLRGGRGRT